MNISPVNNNNTFKGNIIVNNLKKNTTLNIATSNEMDKLITDKFQQVVGQNSLALESPQKTLTQLKNYVKSIADITKTKLGSLKFPKEDELAVIYNSSKNKSQLDVPEYFSITHISK